MSLVANLLSALTRSAAPAARAAMPYSAVGKSAAAAALSATTIGFVRPIWFISVGERPLKIRHRVLFSFFLPPKLKTLQPPPPNSNRLRPRHAPPDRRGRQGALLILPVSSLDHAAAGPLRLGAARAVDGGILAREGHAARDVQVSDCPELLLLLLLF